MRGLGVTTCAEVEEFWAMCSALFLLTLLLSLYAHATLVSRMLDSREVEEDLAVLNRFGGLLLLQERGEKGT